MALPNVTRVGSATGGITSDILYKTLPNGWTYGLSNEIYESFEGTNYENRGIPPHIELGYDKEPKQFCNNLIHKKQNTDAALDSVLKILEGNY